MKEFNSHEDFKQLRGLEKPFKCDSLFIPSEDIGYRPYSNNPKRKPDIYRKGVLVCVDSLGSGDGYCTLPNRRYLNKERNEETTCGHDGSKVILKVWDYEAKKKF